MGMAPVVMFVYNRLDKMRNCLEALECQKECAQTDLHIFSDGGKNSQDEEKVASVRHYLKEEYIPGSKFSRVYLVESAYNKGLAESVISGVTEVIGRYDKAIVVEDDLIVSDDFLAYMNGALDYYENIGRVGSISAYAYPLKELKRYKKDVFILRKGECWGWGTWADRWRQVDWEVSDFNEYKLNYKMRKEFDSIGCGLDAMLCSYMEGTLDTWAARWCYYLFKNNLLTVYPKVSRVRNEGLDGSGANCDVTDRFTNNIIGSDQQCCFQMLDVNRKLEKAVYLYDAGKETLIDRVLEYVHKFKGE